MLCDPVWVEPVYLPLTLHFHNNRVYFNNFSKDSKKMSFIIVLKSVLSHGQV